VAFKFAPGRTMDYRSKHELIDFYAVKNFLRQY